MIYFKCNKVKSKEEINEKVNDELIILRNM